MQSVAPQREIKPMEIDRNSRARGLTGNAAGVVTEIHPFPDQIDGVEELKPGTSMILVSVCCVERVTITHVGADKFQCVIAGKIHPETRLLRDYALAHSTSDHLGSRNHVRRDRGQDLPQIAIEMRPLWNQHVSAVSARGSK